MRRRRPTRAHLLAIAVALAPAGCQRKSDKPAKQEQAVDVTPTDPAHGPMPAPTALRPPKIAPPLPVGVPPNDAEQLTGIEGATSAVIHIKRLTAGTGKQPGRNDTVSLNFTGWRLNGETFLSTTVRKRPVTQSLARLAPGFAAAVASMHVGERAMMWIPPELGYLGPPTGTPETTVYEVELVGFEPAPPTPSDVGAAPSSATRTASGASYVAVKRGSGKERPRFHDLVTMHYSAWNATGRLFDSSEVTAQPKQTFVFREPPGIEETLRTMVVGERKRVWLPPGQVEMLPGTPPGTLCYEVELLSVKKMNDPPPVPSDVAAPPAGARRTPGGVGFVDLKVGDGVTPGPADRVRIHYTGWTTDGRLFDSSVVRGETAVFALNRVIPGLAESLATMKVGGTRRVWIPVELAYKNEPGSPKGTLVFDLALLEILPPKPAPATPPPMPPLPPAPPAGPP